MGTVLVEVLVVYLLLYVARVLQFLLDYLTVITDSAWDYAMDTALVV